MKRIMLVLLSLFLVVAPLSSCGNRVPLNDRTEVYNFDVGYYFYIPKEYEDKITEISVGNTTLVQYTDQVMIMVQAENYYSSLSSDERSEHSRGEYYYGSSLFDSTFNNAEYMMEYFENHIQSIVASKRIDKISLVEINSSTYWECDYTLYDTKINTSTLASEEIYKGEGKIYFHITNGMIYLVSVTASDVHISSLPDAANFMNDFHIGAKYNNLVFYIWLIIGLLIIVTLVWVLKSFVTIELEDVTAETATLQLSSIKEMFKDSRYYNRDSSNDNELICYRLDTILDRIHDDSFNMDERVEQNKLVMKKLDEMLEAQCATDKMKGEVNNTNDFNAGEIIDKILYGDEDDVKTELPFSSQTKQNDADIDIQDTIPVLKEVSQAVENVDNSIETDSVEAKKVVLEEKINTFNKGFKNTIDKIKQAFSEKRDSLKEGLKQKETKQDENVLEQHIQASQGLLESESVEEGTTKNKALTDILDSIIHNDNE